MQLSPQSEVSYKKGDKYWDGKINLYMKEKLNPSEKEEAEKINRPELCIRAFVKINVRENVRQPQNGYVNNKCMYHTAGL